MKAQDCLQILREIKDVAFATVDEQGQPQVRIIDVMLVENGKLYFCTARGKDFYRQLEANGQVAVCGELQISDGAAFRQGASADRAESVDRPYF